MSSLNGEVIVCGQHSGDPVQLRIFGDEFYARYETLEGYSVVYDTTCRSYCYATLARGHFVSTGVLACHAPPAGLKRHLKELTEVRNEKFGRRYATLRPRESSSGSSESRTLGPDDGLLEGRKLSRGTVRGLTLIVNFADVKTNIGPSDVTAMFNADDYTENGNECSVKEYFRRVSNGKLTYTNDVFGPIELSMRRSHYINTLLFEEALEKAVAAHGIDLSAYDSRGEGIVDAINILYAGESQYSGELWPHNSVRAVQKGNVRTHFYQLTGLGVIKSDLRIGTICHENAHMLCRFPDMYDYGERDGDHEKSQGIGRYCLMGSGNHLNERRSPAAVCAYLRDLAGWCDTEVDLNTAGGYVARQGDYGTVMKFRTDKANEYFVVENRAKSGLDKHLPDGGLAVYHCDTLGSNEWQQGTRNQHYQCALLQADGHLDLENNRNAGDEGDLYGSADGVALSHTTLPSSREWDGTDSGLVVSDIGPTGDEIGFVIGAPLVTREVAKASWPFLAIPDNSASGATSSIDIDESGTAKSIAVSVYIIHSWIGDLKISLVAPDGSEAVLHNREGGDGDDINTTWRSSDVESLNALHEKSIQGPWKLKAVDLAAADRGRLIAWAVRLTCQ